ncbi:hypothetical protein [Rhizobium mesosinicum]|uniref:Uncharacterized protein n=1 Tax=Rhizobium mesosinicum TaxID=335017 RepID=A0ABS7GM09_9HYPH|nr:hypothetical protein [Rhizobium mesosinicum]MBW9051029.1 hypothetical protein [Rhizobium mesosinicum]
MTSKSDLLHALEQKPLAYWATIENYRWWLAHDQVYLQLLRLETKISAETVRTIAKAYGINRNIDADEDKTNDRTAAAVANVLNSTDFVKFAEKKTLDDKFEQFLAILRRMPMNLGVDEAKLKFVSGTSKFIWFFAPTCWTMFDRLAAHGAGIRKDLASVERAKRFFTALSSRGFESIIEKARPLFQDSPFRDLSPERLVDKFLWLKGCSPAAQTNGRLTLYFYMQGLPTDLREQLESLANRIAADCEQDLLKLAAKK